MRDSPVPSAGTPGTGGLARSHGSWTTGSDGSDRTVNGHRCNWRNGAHGTGRRHREYRTHRPGRSRTPGIPRRHRSDRGDGSGNRRRRNRRDGDIGTDRTPWAHRSHRTSISGGSLGDLWSVWTHWSRGSHGPARSHGSAGHGIHRPNGCDGGDGDYRIDRTRWSRRRGRTCESDGGDLGSDGVHRGHGSNGTDRRHRVDGDHRTPGTDGRLGDNGRDGSDRPHGSDGVVGSAGTRRSRFSLRCNRNNGPHRTGNGVDRPDRCGGGNWTPRTLWTLRKVCRALGRVRAPRSQSEYRGHGPGWSRRSGVVRDGSDRCLSLCRRDGDDLGHCECNGCAGSECRGHDLYGRYGRLDLTGHLGT